MNENEKKQDINTYEETENKFIKNENEHSLRIYKKNIFVLIIVFLILGLTVRILGTIIQSINTNFNNDTINDLNIMLDNEVENIYEVLDEFYYDELYYSTENNYNIDDDIIIEYMKTYIDIYDFYDDIYVFLKNNVAYKSGKNEREKFYFSYDEYFDENIDNGEYLVIDSNNLINTFEKVILKKFYNFQGEVVALIGIKVTSKDFTMLFNEIIDIIYPNNLMIIDNQGKIIYSTLNTYTQQNKIISIITQKDAEANTINYEKDYLWIKNDKIGANIILIPKYYRNMMIFDVTYYGRIMMMLIDALIVILFIIAGYATNKLKVYKWIGFFVSCILCFAFIGGTIIISKYEYEKNIKGAFRTAWVLEYCLNNHCDENKANKFIYTYYYTNEYYDNKITEETIRQNILKKENIISYDTKFLELTDKNVDVNNQLLDNEIINGKYEKVYKISDDKRILITVSYISDELENIREIINRINNYHLQNDKRNIRDKLLCENFQFSQLNKTYNYDLEENKYTLTNNVFSTNKTLTNDNIELEIDNNNKTIIVKLYKNQDSYLCQKRISFTYSMFDFSDRVGKALVVIVFLYIFTMIYYYLTLYLSSKKVKFIPDEEIENRYNYLNHPITADTYVEDARENEYYMINEYEEMTATSKNEKVTIKEIIKSLKDKISKIVEKIKNSILKKSKIMHNDNGNGTNENLEINLEEYMRYEENEIKKIKDEKVIKFDDDE